MSADLPLPAPLGGRGWAAAEPPTTSTSSVAPLRHHAPRVTVVMATYRRPDLLTRCLDALLTQSLDPAAYEIVVIDDGHTEDTRAAVAAAARRSAAVGGPDVRYYESQGTRGPAGARNRGWRLARGELVAFTDDDTIPDRDWLRAGEAALRDPAHVAAWGRVQVPLPDEMTDHARNTAGLENAVFVTANAFVRRHALIGTGGFDERFTRAWREDSDLYFALQEAHGDDAIVAAPEARVLHPVREAPFGISIGQQENNLFEALLYRKYPDRYDRLVGRRHAPASYYVIVGAAIGAVAAAPFSLPAAGLLAAVSIGGILRFAARRLRGLTRTRRQVADMLVSSAAIPFLSLFWRLAGAWRWRTPFI